MQRHDTTHPIPALRPGTVVIQATAFASELAMLALLAVAGARLGAGTLAAAVALTIVLPVAAGSIWGVWAAPRSSRRLADPYRFWAQTALFAATGLLTAFAAGMAILAIGFALTATLVFALTRFAQETPAAGI